MTLKLPALYSQRDSRWSGKLLGFNTKLPYTIGNYGCLITSLGCIVNKNPDEVNEILKANSGFTTGNGIFIWSKSPCLGLNEIYTSPLYSNPVTNQGIAKIKELLDAKHPVVTHVDFNPATTDDDMHWVVIIGYEENTENFTIFDPWTGTITRLDIYGETRKAIWQFRGYDIVLPVEGSQDTVSVLKTQFEELVRKSTIADKVASTLGKEVNESVILGDLTRLIQLEDAVVEKDRKINELQTAYDTLHEQLVSVTAKYVTLSDAHDETVLQLTEATKKADDTKKSIDSMGQTIASLTSQVESLKKASELPIFSGWKKIVIDILGKI